ncbi:MAG: pilus assembly protein, partial [Inquilinus sp.]|nr:pilus assembly protein [Inquilinus sp.]
MNRGFADNDSGSSVVEFAILAPMFFAMVLTVFDVAIMFGNSVMLDTAAQDGARAVRTGYIYENVGDLSNIEGTAEGDPGQKMMFETAACASIVLIDCDSISYRVARFD